MITAHEFIKSQVVDRAFSARVLNEPTEINGIVFKPGCSPEGIELKKGLEQLAEIYDKEIMTEEGKFASSSGYSFVTRYITLNGVRFYEAKLVKKEGGVNA